MRLTLDKRRHGAYLSTRGFTMGASRSASFVVADRFTLMMCRRCSSSLLIGLGGGVLGTGGKGTIPPGPGREGGPNMAAGVGAMEGLVDENETGAKNGCEENAGGGPIETD